MKILVIDDDRGLRRSLSLILEDAGYAVVQAADGAEGLRMAAAASPAMILCDVRMPEMDGLEFLDHYRESGGTALVLVMTDPDDGRGCGELGDLAVLHRLSFRGWGMRWVPVAAPRRRRDMTKARTRATAS